MIIRFVDVETDPRLQYGLSHSLTFEEVIIRDLVVITFNEAMIFFLSFVTFTFLLFSNLVGMITYFQI
jgi:hypothetical protein